MKTLVTLVIETLRGMTVKDVKNWVRRQVKASGYLFPEDPRRHMRSAVRFVHACSLSYAEYEWNKE